MRFNKKIIFIIMACFLLGSCSAISDDFSIALENDLLCGTDRHYTHATKFLNTTDNVPNWARNILRGEDTKLAFGFAQYMYTPSDISIEELMEDDRPYGGWLYVEALLISRNDWQLDLLGIDAGVTGEASFSDKTQTFIHRSTGSSEPMGWDNQIGTEPGIDLIYQKKIRWRYRDVFDVIPQTGGSLGNIFTYANAGCVARLGYNIPDNFGTLRMEPTTRANDESYGGYIFAGCEERYVFRNIFLDGNTWRDSHSVDKEPWVMDLSFGVGIIVGRFEIIYSVTYRGKEFEKQEKENCFGSLILSWKH